MSVSDTVTYKTLSYGTLALLIADANVQYANGWALVTVVYTTGFTPFQAVYRPLKMVLL